ncbi:PrsW family intramembrane metalloprotease [bacterium]|nr:PrsW family intramembrane metalloprotease [bacterium]
MLPYLLIITGQILAATWFIRYVIIHDRGSKEPRGAVRASLLFGLLAIVIVFVTHPIQSDDAFVSLRDGTAPIQSVFIASMIIGIVEELAKSIPLALWLYKKPYFNEMTDGIFYFGMSSVMFALIENILYTLSDGASTGLARIIFTPFLHIGFAMWFGFFLARRKVTGRGTWMVVVGLLTAIILHGLYDFGVFSRLGPFTIASVVLGISLNLGVFKLYRYAQQHDKELQLSADGTNHFCRSCGRPNPDHTLYCVYCGQKT